MAQRSSLLSRSRSLARGLLLCGLLLAALAPAADCEEPGNATWKVRRPKVGLALSGGGAKGLAHIGVLKVLEEAGLEVDCISGTSMGAIIGALYSIGYSPRELEQIVYSQDWRVLLTDRIPHRHLSIREKRDDGRYLASFPIRDRKIRLPRGLVAGQNLATLLGRLTLPVHHVEDFHELPIPFCCVATDLVTGEAVVLEHGFLPDALRASMSIPTIFTPVELEGRLLVDGYLVRDLPASDVRELGADIVIGVDVAGALQPREELTSLMRILDQAGNIRGQQYWEKQRSLVDLMIEPDLGRLTFTDFERADSLIARGERSARAHLPALRALADSLNKLGGPAERFRARLAPIERCYLTEVRFEGLREVSPTLLANNLRLNYPAVVTPEMIQAAVERAYGTYFFERVGYRLEPAREGTRLVLRVTERDDAEFKFGLQYDNYLKAAVALNATFRNLYLEGSRLSLSARLSENPVYQLDYFTPFARSLGLGAGLDLTYRGLDVATFRADGSQEASLDYSLFESTLYLETMFSNLYALGLGLQYRHSAQELRFAPPQWRDEMLALMTVLAYARYNSFDRAVFPRRGLRVIAEARTVTDWLGSLDRRIYEPFEAYTLSLAGYLPLRPRISLLGSFYAGRLSSDRVPSDLLYFVGGAESSLNQVCPFMGLYFMERPGSEVLVAQAGVQFEIGHDNFLILRQNVGRTRFAGMEERGFNDMLTGFGATAGTLTPFGPLELSLMWGSERRDPLTHVSLGYRF